jgi:hypothetical protein
MGVEGCGSAAMRILVADTGPLLHLDEAGAMNWLARLGEVHVTPAVIAEPGKAFRKLFTITAAGGAFPAGAGPDRGGDPADL